MISGDGPIHQIDEVHAGSVRHHCSKCVYGVDQETGTVLAMPRYAETIRLAGTGIIPTISQQRFGRPLAPLGSDPHARWCGDR